jgi:hypothetical protein
VHGVGSGGFHFQAEIGRVAVGPADAELFYFEPAVEFDDRVEDLLHDVRVNQVTLCFHDLLWKHGSTWFHVFF